MLILNWVAKIQPVPGKALSGDNLGITVAGFVQDAEERLVEVARVVARADAAVAGTDAAAKGVRGHIEPARGEVEADGHRHGG